MVLLGRLIPPHETLWHNGRAIRLVQHGVKLGAAEMERPTIAAAIQMGMPNSDRGLLEFFPSKGAEPFRTWEPLDVGPNSGQICDGGVCNGRHQAAD